MTRSLGSLIAALLAALCLVLALLPAAPVSAPAERTARAAAASGLAVYVALRSVNAVLSTAQEVELGGSAVVSASLQPLKVLEPVDDTVERVSNAVFAVTLLAGVLAISVGPVSSLGFLLLAAGLAIEALRAPLRTRLGAIADPVCRAGRACNLTGLVLAVLLPLSLALGSTLGARLTQGEWDRAQADLSAIAAHADAMLSAAEPAAPQGDSASQGGALGWLREAFASAGRGIGDAASQTGAYLDAAGYFYENADTLFRASLTIVAVFLLRTLILPITLVIVFLVLARRLASR